MHRKSAHFISGLFGTGNLLSDRKRRHAVRTILQNIKTLTIDSTLMMLMSFSRGQCVPYFNINHRNDIDVQSLHCDACGQMYMIDVPKGCIQPPCSHCDAMQSFTIKDIMFDQTSNNLCYLKVQYLDNTYDWLWVCEESLHQGTTFNTLALPNSIKQQRYDILMQRYIAYRSLQHRIPDVIAVLLFAFIG